MSIISVIGTMGLVLVAVVIFCCGSIWLEKQAHDEFYDERQLLVRGRAYQLSSGVAEFCWLAMVSVFIYQVDGDKIIEPYLALIGTFVVKSLVFHTYCTINHAALPASQKPLINFIGFVFMGSLWLYSAVRYIHRAPLSLIGYGSWGVAQLVGVCYLYAIAMMYLIQLLRREKE